MIHSSNFLIFAALEDSGLARCEDIVAIKNRTVNWRKYVQTGLNRRKFNDEFNLTENAEKTIECFKKYSEILLNDSMQLDPKYRFMLWTDPEKPVFMAVIGIDSLSRGEHSVLFKYVKDGEDRGKFHIPFWKD